MDNNGLDPERVHIVVPHFLNLLDLSNDELVTAIAKAEEDILVYQTTIELGKIIMKSRMAGNPMTKEGITATMPEEIKAIMEEKINE